MTLALNKPLPRLTDVAEIKVMGKTHNPEIAIKGIEAWARRLVEDLFNRFSAIGLDVNSLLSNISLPAGGTITITEYDGTNDAPAPSDNAAVIYVKDNGAGKEQLMVRFNTGSAVQIAIEP